MYSDLNRIEDKRLRGGFGAKMFAAQVESLIEHGIDRIEGYIAGNYKASQDPNSGSDWVGYNVWPRLGYDAEISAQNLSVDYDHGPADVVRQRREQIAELSRILQVSPEEIPHTYFNLSKLMKTPEGREFWRRHGGWLNAEFDLKKGSTSRQVLSEYRKRKGYDDPAGPDRFRRRSGRKANT